MLISQWIFTLSFGIISPNGNGHCLQNCYGIMELISLRILFNVSFFFSTVLILDKHISATLPLPSSTPQNPFRICVLSSAEDKCGSIIRLVLMKCTNVFFRTLTLVAKIDISTGHLKVLSTKGKTNFSLPWLCQLK